MPPGGAGGKQLVGYSLRLCGSAASFLMPKIKVNGKEIEAPAGQKLLQVLMDQGTFVPHYCWHPGLQPAGNCRMCLVKVSNSRKLEVSCMYPLADNLEVTTEG